VAAYRQARGLPRRAAPRLQPPKLYRPPLPAAPSGRRPAHHAAVSRHRQQPDQGMRR